MGARARKGNPVTSGTLETERREKIGRVVRRLAKDIQGLRDSLSRAVGVCNGFDPTVEEAEFQHRVKSITGKIKAFRKAGRVFVLALQELESLADV